MNKSSPAYILGFMLVISIVFGTGVAFVHYATQDLLAEKEALHRNRIIARAFKLKVENESAQAYEQALERTIEISDVTYQGRTWTVYRRIGEGSNNIGFRFTGLGFWDRIYGVIVLTPDLEEIVNIQFLEHKETPGLGARIEEPWFTGQFEGLRIAWDAPINQRIIIGPSPRPDAVNQVDAITGASQTSLALMNILNEELAAFRELYEEKLRNREGARAGAVP